MSSASRIVMEGINLKLSADSVTLGVIYSSDFISGQLRCQQYDGITKFSTC